MPVVDTSVLLCGLAYPHSYSARFLRKSRESVVISNRILAEATSVAARKAPNLVVPMLKYAQEVRSVEIHEVEIKTIVDLTGGHEDDHLLAVAVKAHGGLAEPIGAQHGRGNGNDVRGSGMVFRGPTPYR